MKTIKKNRYFIIVCTALLGLTACHDKVTDLEPISTLTEANFYQSADDMERAVLGIYSTYQSRMPRDWALLEMPTDHLHMSSYRHIGGMEAINNLDFQPQNDLFQNFWEVNYNGIFRANAVLSYLDTPEDYADGQKARVEGEARFMRALFYFDLVRAFGGVPLVSSLLTVEEAQATPRATEQEVYAFIVEDLEAAVNMLPLPGDIATGRASQGAAKALLGKVYVYLENWENALKYLNMVEAYNYQLVDDFASLWTIENEDNEEVIFAMKYTQDTDGHILTADFIPYFGIEGISSSGMEAADLSWSLHKKYEGEDTRKAATITEYWHAPDSPDPEEWRPYVSKFVVPQAGSDSGLDLPVLRYADVILLKAEALYRLNQPEQALAGLNRIRTRAFGGTEHNYVMADIATEEAFIDKLLLERQLEFAMENERWFDLVRTGRLMEALAEVELGYNKSTETAQVVRLDPQPYHRYFPIPQHEIDQADPGVLAQNEGY